MDARGPSSVSDNPSRRRVLALAGAGGAALAAALLPQGAARAGHGTPDNVNALHLGVPNTAPAGSTTVVDADVDGHAFTVRNANTGEAAGAIQAIGSASSKPVILANCDNENTFAVLGVSSSPGFTDFGGGNGKGVAGQSGGGTGVEGSSVSGTGVAGWSVSGVGVSAISGPDPKGPSGGQALAVIGTARIEATTIDPGAALAVTNLGTGDALSIAATTFGSGKPAILGENRGGAPGIVGVSSSPEGFGDGDGMGVQGMSASGIGIHGEATGGTGVKAVAGPTRRALHVSGRAVFESAGTGVLPAGANQVAVAAPFVGVRSQVLVTLTGNPGNRELRWVQVNPGVGFVVHLSPAPPNGRPATPFVFLVLDR